MMFSARSLAGVLAAAILAVWASASAFGVAGSALRGAQAPADEPLAAYREFVAALDKSQSLADLSRYLPADMRERLEEMPDDMAPQVLERMRDQATPPPAGWKTLGSTVTGDRARLRLQGHRMDGDIRVVLVTTVELVREDGAWRVERPEPWTSVEVLPASLDAGEAGPPGPGAVATGSTAFDPGAYRPAAKSPGAGNTWDGSIVFDPNGRYVALGDSRGGTIRLLELPGLREVWSAQLPHLPGTLSFRFDGRAIAVVSEAGYAPEVLPLKPNVERTPPTHGYFFSSPVLPAVLAAVEERPQWTAMAYHPRNPLLALGVGDFEDNARSVIALQPTGEGLWIPGGRDAAPTWPTRDSTQSLVWAAAGTHLAWLSNADTGATIHVASYPSGEAREISRSGFAPGRIAISADGQRVAAAGAMGDDPVQTALVWDVTTGAEVASLPGVARLAFAPDGRHVFAVRDTGTMVESGVGDAIHIRAPGAPAAVATIVAFPADARGAHYVAALAISPNGRFLAAVSNSGEMRLWDAAAR